LRRRRVGESPKFRAAPAIPAASVARARASVSSAYSPGFASEPLPMLHKMTDRARVGLASANCSAAAEPIDTPITCALSSPQASSTAPMSDAAISCE
jgi:hypothetical protein